MIPNQPWAPPLVPDLPDDHFTERRCPVCGLEEGTNNYVCSRNDCPMGLAPVIILKEKDQ